MSFVRIVKSISQPRKEIVVPFSDKGFRVENVEGN